MFGELYDDSGLPVLAILELQPEGDNNVILDEIKIASTYGKDNPQSLIDSSKILYIDPNKNRTDKWLARNRLQLPFLPTDYGSINRVTYKNDSVNTKSAMGKCLVLHIRLMNPIDIEPSPVLPCLKENGKGVKIETPTDNGLFSANSHPLDPNISQSESGVNINISENQKHNKQTRKSNG